jgi:hypothetical protein
MKLLATIYIFHEEVARPEYMSDAAYAQLNKSRYVIDLEMPTETPFGSSKATASATVYMPETGKSPQGRYKQMRTAVKEGLNAVFGKIHSKIL